MFSILYDGWEYCRIVFNFVSMRGKFILRAFITAVIYSSLLLPFELNLPMLAGTDIRPSAFIPIVFGIFWGMPAAVGIFVGNLVCDFFCINSPLIILGSLLNGLSAICARKLFYASWNHGVASGGYIYSSGSLANFLYSMVCVEFALCLPISLTVHFYSGATVWSAFSLIFLNNVHSNIIFGIPAMLFLPVLKDYANEPKGSKGNIRGNVIALCFILSSVLFILPFILAEPHISWSALTVIPLVGAAIAAPPTPPVKREKYFFGFQSIRYKTFRELMVIALCVSVLVSVSVILIIRNGEQGLELFTKAYHVCAYMSVMFLILFAFSYHVVEKNLLVPVLGIASKLSLDGEKYSNELDILSKRLDFVVLENSAFLTGNEFSIIVGLTSKDNTVKYSIQEAREIINGICLKHVGGYLSSLEAEGGYAGGNIVGHEQVLIYTVYGASDEQICDISNDIIHTLNQESVLIEKNRMIRNYYYGKDADPKK